MGALVELPTEPRIAALGVGGACRRWSSLRGHGGRRMRAVPLGAPVELPMEPRIAALGVGGACGRCHWGLR
eukprot:667924-Pyramimonas_sp.AAC.1